MSGGTGAKSCASIVTCTEFTGEPHIKRKVTEYTEVGEAATTSVGIGNFHPIIDIGLLPCGTETEVDATSKGICADGTHIVDFEKDFIVIKHLETIHDETHNKGSKATDSIVIITRKENKPFTHAPNTDTHGNSKKATNGEETGIPAYNQEAPHRRRTKT